MMKLKPNGTLPISLGLRGAFLKLDLIGGPYDAYPGRDEAFGVCVRAEHVPEGNYDLHLPIEDFSVPRNVEQATLILKQTLAAAFTGSPVYIGCMGGWGRTGLFMALLAKAAGIEKPVEFVREHYTPRAVETPKQYAYVQNFDVSELQAWLPRAAWKARLTNLFAWF